MDVLTLEDALVGVFVEHRALLKRAAHRILGDGQVAEDLVQDAYLKTMEAARSQADVRQPLSYAYRVVRNLAIDQQRRGRFEAQLFEAADNGLQMAAPNAHSPESLAIDRQELTRLSQALGEIPERMRRVFELYRLEGCTQREIGERLGLSAATVNQLIRQTLEHCRAALRRA